MPCPGAAPKLPDVVEASACVWNASITAWTSNTPGTSTQKMTDLCPGHPLRRRWLRWAQHRRRRTSWSGYTGSGRQGTSTCSHHAQPQLSYFKTWVNVVIPHWPPHLVVVELRLAGHHVPMLWVVILLASNSTEHVELLADTTRHRSKSQRAKQGS